MVRGSRLARRGQAPRASPAPFSKAASSSSSTVLAAASRALSPGIVSRMTASTRSVPPAAGTDRPPRSRACTSVPNRCSAGVYRPKFVTRVWNVTRSPTWLKASPSKSNPRASAAQSDGAASHRMRHRNQCSVGSARRWRVDRPRDADAWFRFGTDRPPCPAMSILPPPHAVHVGARPVEPRA